MPDLLNWLIQQLTPYSSITGISVLAPIRHPFPISALFKIINLVSDSSLNLSSKFYTTNYFSPNLHSWTRPIHGDAQLCSGDWRIYEV
jgi:hypothetical protein